MSTNAGSTRWERWYPWIEFFTGVVGAALVIDWIYGAGKRAGRKDCNP